MTCRVLIVDDDPACGEEYVEIAETLGYGCVATESAGEALKLIANQSDIGIVVTDLQMPELDGIGLLHELSARFAATRPLVTVVITGFGTFETAVQAMRSNAIDFLTKPVSREQFAAALRQGTERWTQLAGQFYLTQIFSTSRKIESPLDRNFKSHSGLIAVDRLRDIEMLNTIRSIIKSREQRNELFEKDLFSDPSWDILLDLTAARIEGIQVPVSAACAAARVPATTAFRYVTQLVELGLVRRWKDPADQRRVLLELGDDAFCAMTEYLAATT